MEDPTPSAIAHAALDALLGVLASSAEDLRLFHDAIANARVAELPPFPRETVILTESIIDRLTKVDEELDQVLTALGLPRRTR